MSFREWAGAIAIAFVAFQVFTLAVALSVAWLSDRHREQVRAAILHQELEEFLQNPPEES